MTYFQSPLFALKRICVCGLGDARNVKFHKLTDRDRYSPVPRGYFPQCVLFHNLKQGVTLN